MTYEDKSKNLETLPWQALFDAAISKGIEESEVKGKDKGTVIQKILLNNLLDDQEIEQLVNNYIYGDRVTFTLWNFENSLSDAQREKILALEGCCDPFVPINGFRNLKIISVKEFPNRYELLYVYSKSYNFTNEEGKSDSVWELHRGCVWIGIQNNYLASISKHDKMTRLFVSFLTSELSSSIKQIKPPKTAIERCVRYIAISRIVLQSATGEKTTISKSDGFTDAQLAEADRLREDRYDTSGSYIAAINDKTSATVKYNVNKGNIGIFKHLSAPELFEWSENAIKIILEEIEQLRGKPAAEIFRELGLDLKWSISDTGNYSNLNWLLTEVIASMNDDTERVTAIPSEFQRLLYDNSLFLKIPRVYCHECDSYEIPICGNCGKALFIGSNGQLQCTCDSPLSITCGEGHKRIDVSFWYIPTARLKNAIDKNIRKIYKDDDLIYSLCIMGDTLHLLHGEGNPETEIAFKDISCFQSNNGFDSRIKAFAIRMNEKCSGTCSYAKINKCVSDDTMSCLPKAFYTVLPGYRPQPHMNGEYGDVAGQISVGNRSYEMKGIIKKNTKNTSTGRVKPDSELINEPLRSTSKEGQEIIRQFVEQGLADSRTEVISVIAPQYFDANLKGTLRYLARLGKKKVIFTELDDICSLLAMNNSIRI